MRQHRYPGVRPFEQSEQNLFFGREMDIQRVHDLLLLEKIIVLFGKSGYGKSSMLNAGLIPRLEAGADNGDGGYKPLLVRFRDYQSDTQQSPIQTVIRQLEAHVPEEESAAYLDGFFPKESSSPRLWYSFKRRSNTKRQQFILFFDQFEEFFSYPEEQQALFRRQLSELLFTKIPQSIRNASDDLPDAEFSHLVAPMDIKVLISIRGDRLQLLDSLKDTLPGILNKRYELSALSKKQAEEAIVQPASLSQAEHGFLSPAFVFSDEALNALLTELTKSQHSVSGGVEAFQLQIVCEYIESRVRDGLIPFLAESEMPVVLLEHLPDFNVVFERYYESRLSDLPAELLRPAQLIIENGLLFADSATGDARRLSVDGAFLLQQFATEGADEDLLDRLERSYLVRREPNSLGGYNYEISHDTLIAPVQRAKFERESKEEQHRLERLQLEQEAQLKIEQQKQQRARRLALVMAMLALVSLLALAFAGVQYKLAREQEKEATEALANFLKQKRAKETLQIQELLREAGVFLEAGYPENALQRVLEAYEIDSTNQQTQLKLEQVKKALINQE